MEVPFELPAIIFLLFLSGIFSGFETSFVSLDPAKIKNIIKDRHEDFYIFSPRKVLSLILIGNNFVNVGIAVLLTEFFYRNISKDFSLEMGGLISFAIILLFGEAFPKVFAREHPVFFFKTFHKFIYFIYRVFTPVISFVENIIYTLISRFIKIESRYFSKKDMEMVSIIRETEGIISKEFGRSFRSFLKFSEKGIQEAVRARTELFALNYELSIEEIKKRICESGFTRVPVYINNLDNIIGILHIKDIPYIKQKKDLKKYLRTPLFIPEKARLEEVLEMMKKEGTSFVIVVDEYGGTSGFATMGDILIELFGESQESMIAGEARGSRSIILNAHTRIDDLQERYFISFPKGEYETLSGFILKQTGRIPEKGESLLIDDFKIEILDATPRGIKTVRLETISDEE